MFLRTQVSKLLLLLVLVGLVLVGCSEKEFSLTVNIEGNGKVQLSPEQVSYKKGTTVVLTATPDPEWSFTQWNGSASGTQNPISVVINSNMNVAASFKRVNRAPVLNSIGEKTVMVGQELTFTVAGTDPDGDVTAFAASNLPGTASFNPNTQTFFWTPVNSNVGTHDVTFSITDGNLTDSEVVKITVTNNMIMVPGDYSTIQSAIEAAADGMTVCVDQGTYYENINFKGKAITVSSTAPTDTAIRNATIIDGQLLGPVVTFGDGETASAVLTGFTIQNGKALTDSNGAGIDIQASSPTISYNLIMNNQGSGVLAHTSEASIENNTIKANSSIRGGGVHIVRESSADLANNYITQNQAEDGGGVCIDSSSFANLADNSISGNTATRNGGGVAVIYTSSASLYRNMIDSNKALYGGGLYFRSNPVDVANTTGQLQATGNYIGFNSVTCYGGGMWISTGSDHQFVNNTIENNSARECGGGACFSFTTASFQKNIITSNTLLNGDGAGVYLEKTIIAITDNKFDQNQSGRHGDALSLTYSSYATLDGNSFTNHTFGSAIYIPFGSNLRKPNGENWQKGNVPPAVDATNSYSNNSPYDVHFGE